MANQGVYQSTDSPYEVDDPNRPSPFGAVVGKTPHSTLIHVDPGYPDGFTIDERDIQREEVSAEEPAHEEVNYKDNEAARVAVADAYRQQMKNGESPRLGKPSRTGQPAVQPVPVPGHRGVKKLVRPSNQASVQQNHQGSISGPGEKVTFELGEMASLDVVYDSVVVAGETLVLAARIDSGREVRFFPTPRCGDIAVHVHSSDMVFFAVATEHHFPLFGNDVVILKIHESGTFQECRTGEGMQPESEPEVGYRPPQGVLSTLEEELQRISEEEGQ